VLVLLERPPGWRRAGRGPAIEGTDLAQHEGRR
jgi:hypothetical protein